LCLHNWYCELCILNYMSTFAYCTVWYFDFLWRSARRKYLIECHWSTGANTCFSPMKTPFSLMLFLTFLFWVHNKIHWTLELWVSEQCFDVSSFWTKFNNHNKDEGNRSNFSPCFFLSKAPYCLPRIYCPTPSHWDLLTCSKANIIFYRWQAVSTPTITAPSSECIHQPDFHNLKWFVCL